MFSFKFIIDDKKLSLKNFPINPPLPLIDSQKELEWNIAKNREPKIEYKTVKNKFSIIINNFFFLKRFIPVKNIVIEIRIEIKPIKIKQPNQYKIV